MDPKYVNKEYSFFVGNVLMDVRNVFLPYYPLILSLLRLRLGVHKPMEWNSHKGKEWNEIK